MGKSYEHFSEGDKVRIDRSWRSKDTAYGPASLDTFTDHAEGVEGEIVSMTNAGFRGLEYTVWTDEGTAHGVSADDLVLVAAVPVKPWPGQRTYRDGQVVA